jgi:rhamnogalacturonyl hydrolase YesR
MKRLTLLLLSFLVLASAADARARRKKPVAVQDLPTIEIITKVNDYWQQHHKPQVRSFWDEAAYHTGNMEAYKLLGVARWKNYSEDWARHNKWMGAREKDPSKWKYNTYGEGQDFVLFGDWQICFQTYLDLYELNPDEFKIRRAIEVMDAEVRSKENDFWWWADALYMVMPVMTKLYKTTGEVKYLDKLYDNFKWADALMYDKDEQLYYRDAKYIYPKVKTVCNGGKSFWARGDGWVLAGLAKVLSDMPQDYQHRDFFVQRFRELAEGVARVQRPGGYWSRSMLCEEDAPGPETSGTAFFTYGLLWGVNHGLLSRSTYEPVINKAWDYLVHTALQADGSVGFVQPIGEKPDPTKTVDAHSQANFGVGAFLLAACEKVRYDDGSVNGSGPLVGLAVKNPSNEFRQQVIEVDAKTLYNKLGIQGGRQFIVFDEGGLEVPYQLSSDGQVLLDAGVRPQGQLTFNFRKGTPKNYATVCYGRVYNERKDDYAWENDRGAYRVYGPALQRTGERSYGTDVWSKNTPELVVEQRYWIEDVVMMPEVEKLRKENRQRGDSLYRLNSYHNDHGRGMDLYKVGATLGCGTPALMVNGELKYPYCFKSMEILDNGPMRTTVHLTYNPVDVNGDTAVVEHRYIQLDKGSNFNKIIVTYNGLTKPVSLATGVVLHSEEKENVELGKDYLLYADPTDNVRVNNCQLFLAVLFPQSDVETKKLMFEQSKGGNDGHALGVSENYRGENYTYYFGSAWSKYDVRTMQEWQQRAAWTMRSIRQPLQVEWK